MPESILDGAIASLMHSTETFAYQLDEENGVYGVDKFHPPQGSHFDPSYEWIAGIAQQRPGSVNVHGHSVSPFGKHPI